MSKTKLLIVEDQGIVAADIKECLIELGYQVVAVASSGNEAIELAGVHHPDLILMDIVLKGEMDGIAAAAAVRELHDIPVVYLTAHADKATLDKAKVTVPYGYVLKPFREIELRTAIELAVYNHSARSGQEVSFAAEAEFAVEEEEPAEPADTPQSGSEQQAEALSYLQRVKFIEQLPLSDLRLIADSARFSTHENGEFIVAEGDCNVSGFVVISGRVSMVKTSPTGKDLIVELLPPGDPFGILCSIDNAPYPVNVRSQIKSRIMWIPRTAVLTVLRRYPELNRQFVQEIFDRLRSAHNIARALAHDSSEIRIATALCSLVPKFHSESDDGNTVLIEMTRQELAELVGSTTETAIRLTKALERDGILDLSRTGIMKILNLPALTNLSQRESGL
jgi:CRP-like cAMP-binding protein/DNA-binding NarL/FixJ family response regulator